MLQRPCDPLPGGTRDGRAADDGDEQQGGRFAGVEGRGRLEDVRGPFEGLEFEVFLLLFPSTNFFLFQRRRRTLTQYSYYRQGEVSLPCSGLALYAPPQARVTCGISRYRGRFLLLINFLFRLFFLQGTRKKKQANGDEMAGGGGLGGLQRDPRCTSHARRSRRRVEPTGAGKGLG